MKRQLWAFALLGLLAQMVSLPGSANAQTEASDYGIQEVAQINRLIRQGWLDYEIRPSVAASDGEWVRRVYLDILGRIPSVEELREFTQERSPEKRKALVTKLLYDEEYTEQYANNWTTIWKGNIKSTQSRPSSPGQLALWTMLSHSYQGDF